MVSEIENELRKNEKLVWIGRPKQGIVFRPNDLFIIPFSLFWILSVLIFELGALQPNLPIFLSLLGLPFFIIGLFLLFGRYIMDTLRRKNIFYWITDQRIIIKGEKFKNKFRSYPISEINRVELKLKSKKYGTIILGDETHVYGRGVEIEELYWLNPKRYSRLEIIEDARYVFDNIVRFKQGSQDSY